MARAAQRRWLGGGVLVVASCALALLASAGPTDAALLRGTGSSRPAATSPARAAQRGFRIAGSSTGLYPGVSKPLTLTVTNPQAFAIVVTSITTTVASPNPSCAASNLTVAAFTGHLRVAAHRKAHVAVTISLSHAAPDACQGAVFDLTYAGLGRKA